MKRPLLLIASVLLAVFASGCISFSYEGEEYPATASVALYKNTDALTGEYSVIGKAAVSGDYHGVSRERLEQRLLDEAADRGADAVVITAEQVIPTGESTLVDPTLRTMAATEPETGSGINQMYQDFKGGYGTALSDRPVAETVQEYRRIIRADFLRLAAPAAVQPPEPANREAGKPAEPPSQ